MNGNQQVNNDKNYILYVRDYCGFCNRVTEAIGQLGVDVELRNIWQDSSYEEQLVAATGKRVVPVLAISEAEGQTTWMPESMAIIRYLQAQSGAS